MRIWFWAVKLGLSLGGSLYRVLVFRVRVEGFRVSGIRAPYWGVPGCIWGH